MANNYHVPDLDDTRLKNEGGEFPSMVIIPVSYVCNSRCPNCAYTNSDIRESYKDTPFMPDELFKRISDECGKYGALIRVSGGGEPLISKRIIDQIEYAKGVGARIGLITNGSLLTPERVDRLLKVNTDAIEISADAADKETYEKVRPGLNFDKLVKNVTYLVNKRNELKSKSRVIVSIINQKELKGKLEPAVSYWNKIVDDVQVRKYLTWSICDPSQSADSTPYIPELPVRVPCPFPFERIMIDVRGKISFCAYDIRFETDFGNVHNISIKQAWQGEKFMKWRRLLLEGKYEEIPVCSKCPDWKYRSWHYNYWNILNKADKKKEAISDSPGEFEDEEFNN